jgi:PAS domain S-box-containing protein
MKRSLLLRYGVAILAVGVVLGLKVLLDPLLTQQSPFLLLAGAVMVGAWFGGLGPGLVATAVGALGADYLFLPPIGSFTRPAGVGFLPVLLFILQGLLISSLAGALRSARQQAETSMLKTRRNQEGLRRSEERFRLLVQGVEDYAIFMLDPEGRITTWNEGSKRLKGYRAEEIIGEHFSIFFTREDVERGRPEEELRATAVEGRYEEEGLRVRKDGSRFWAHGLITALRDEEGNLKGFSGVTRDITERKQAEKTLRESEQRFRQLFENSADALFVHDRHGRFVDCNAEACRVLGYAREELLELSVADVATRLISAEERREKKGETLWERAMRNKPGRIVGFEENELRRKDGTTFPVEVGVGAIEYKRRRLIFAAARDTTERKRTEVALRESEELYRTVVEQAAENIFIVDPENKRILEANATFYASLGYTPEEVEDRTLYDLVVADPRSIDTNVRRILEGQTFTGERCYRHKDGSLIDVEVNASMLFYGGREAMCVVAHDVTERKRAEEALRGSEAKYRTLVEQMPAVTYIEAVDSGERRTDLFYVSPQIEAMFGYSPEEWMANGQLFEKLLHPDDRERVLAEDARTDGTGEPFSVEYRQFTRDGGVIWLRDEATLVRNEEDRPLFWQGVMHDITDQKRAEERLRSTLDSLLALYEAGQLLGSSLKREEIGSGLLEVVERILGLEVAIITLRDGQSGLKEWRGVGPEGVLASVREEPQARSASREVSEGGRIRSLELRLTEDSGAERRLRGLFVPLRVRDRVVGVLEAYGPQALVEREAEETLSSLASQAASALENARLYEELSEHERQLQDLVGQLVVAQEEERRRVAYDVHDGLTQLAVAAYQRLQMLAEDHPPGSAEGREELEDIVGLVRRVVGEARRVIADLRPTTLDDLGLAAALRVQLEKFRAEGYETSYEQALGEERLPTTVETTLFRVAQEALANTRKHARADRLHIALERRDDAIRLEVRDWGRGFDPSRVGPGGGPGERVGLSGMRERVVLLGGDLEIRSAPGEGTSVVVEVPLPQKTEGKGNHGG